MDGQSFTYINSHWGAVNFKIHCLGGGRSHFFTTLDRKIKLAKQKMLIK